MDARHCTACGAQLAEGVSFCTSCGAGVQAKPPPRCHSCGAGVPEGASFCTSCGAAIKAEAPTPSVKADADATKAAEPPSPDSAPEQKAPTTPAGRAGGRGGMRWWVVPAAIVGAAPVVLFFVWAGAWFAGYDLLGLGQSEAEEHFVEGMELHIEGRSEEAIDEFNKGIEADPDYDENYAALGLVYVDLAEYERAIGYLSTAIELAPGDAGHYNLRGIAYHYLENYEKAMDDLQKALELDPNYAWAYCNRGFVYESLGDLEQAKADYEKALSLAGDDQELIARINLAIELLKAR